MKEARIDRINTENILQKTVLALLSDNNTELAEFCRDHRNFYKTVAMIL